jgi:mannosyl-3-phosphoglycerate synthase
MRLKYPQDSVCIGNVEVNALSRVIELDSGLITGPSKYKCHVDGSMTACHSYDSIQKIEQQLAIIVPCMNEELSILHGVLCGIPHHCLIIVVSNSTADNFQAEQAMVSNICEECPRHALIAHQTDPCLASAFAGAGLPQIVHHDPDTQPQKRAGRIRNGKGEAMMIGTAIAEILGKQFVGFIDADNFVPGAVHEYCKVFATGLYHALYGRTSPHANANPTDEQTLAMVRIKWASKPKIVDGALVHQSSGRCSRVVNAWMNRLLTSLTGNPDHSDFIQTANAGEHAMSTELALKLNFATGYAVEPYQLIDLWERWGAPHTLPTSPLLSASWKKKNKLAEPATPRSKVRIMQIETLNPHIHDFSKGEEHIARMQAQGLSTIFHSRLSEPVLRMKLRKHAKNNLGSVVSKYGVPEEARVYPPMEGMDFEVFKKLF